MEYVDREDTATTEKWIELETAENPWFPPSLRWDVRKHRGMMGIGHAKEALLGMWELDRRTGTWDER